MLQETSGGDNTNGAAARKDGIPNGTTVMRDTATTEGDKAKRVTVTSVLNDALATEVIGRWRYRRQYFMTAGICARHVKARFLQHVTEERAHADQLVERTVQLGGKAELSSERLLKGSQAEYIEGELLLQMITADLIAERIAVETEHSVPVRMSH